MLRKCVITRLSLASKESVNLGNRRGALADGGAHALDRSGANISNRENPGHAALQRHAAILARRHESMVIKRDAAMCQPFCDWNRAQE